MRVEVGGMSGEAEVLLFMIDAGGGHRAAARALVAAAEESHAPFDAAHRELPAGPAGHSIRCTS